jgi:hypothetical protein
LVSTADRPFEDRWSPLAGQGTLGASYLPCCTARLIGDSEWVEARARLALLWSERAAALRFRRSVLAMTARSREQRLELARLEREAFAYDAGAARIRRLAATRVAWLVELLRERRADRVVGAAFTGMAAELAVLHVARCLADAPDGLVESLSLLDHRRARPA